MNRDIRRETAMKKEWNFDEVIDRSRTRSVKWEPAVLEKIFGRGRGDLLPLWVADMDFYCPPGVIEAMQARVAHGLFGYTAHDPGHDRALINWFRDRHGWEIDPSTTVSTPGVVPGVNYLIQCFTKPGDRVLIQPPVYYPFAASIRANGRGLSENPLRVKNGRYEMDLDDLAAKTRDPRVKLAILCSPHNPVGRVWSREELISFGRICIENKVLIFADEIHCDLVMPGFRHTSFQSISEAFAMTSIAANAASKTFNLAGLAHSTLVLPNEKLKSELGIYLETLGLDAHGSASLFGITAARAAYETAGPWLEDLIRYLHENYLFVKTRIETELPGVRVFDLEATYLPWIDFGALGIAPHRIPGIVETAAGLALDHGDWFGLEGRGFERINIACPRKTLETAVIALTKAFKPFCS